MSWPADGKPRFVMAEVSGSLETTSRTSSLANATVMVLDRAFCHRVVGNFRSEDQQKSGGKSDGRSTQSAIAKTRALGAELVARLNGDPAAVVVESPAPETIDLNDREATAYLGFGLIIGERQVAVHTPEGRFICEVSSVAAARRIVRGYRKAAA